MNGNVNNVKIMNTLLNKRIPSLSLYFVNKNDELIQNEQTIANEFISYFSSCCSNLHYNIARIESLSHTNYLCDPVSETLYFHAKTENGSFEVCKLLKKTLIRVDMII